MSRLEDLQRFYALLEALCRRCSGMQMLRNPGDPLHRFERGVCFLFDTCERRTDSGAEPRVVHIGPQRQRFDPTRLSESASTSTGEPSEASGWTLAKIPNLPSGSMSVPRWLAARRKRHEASLHGDRKTPENRSLRGREHRLEPGSRAYIEALPFFWLSVPNQPGGPDLQGFIKRNALALLSNSGKRLLDPASEEWLGCYSDQPAICDSHPWNVDHVDEIHHPALLDLVADLVGVGKPGVASSAHPQQDRSARDSPGFGIREVMAGEAEIDHARRIVAWYEARWTIEEHLRILKVGTRVEDRKLDHADDLRKCLAFDTVTAWRVMDLERRARDTPSMPALKMFSEHEIDVLYVWLKHRRVIRAPPEMPPDIRTFVINLARLAGFRPSKRQPLPGTEKIWQAWRSYKEGLDAVNAWEKRGNVNRVNSG